MVIIARNVATFGMIILVTIEMVMTATVLVSRIIDSNNNKNNSSGSSNTCNNRGDNFSSISISDTNHIFTIDLKTQNWIGKKR